jgi:hypothetical protein
MKKYFYKNENDWVAFSLPDALESEWNAFCRELMHLRPEAPNPQRSDYLAFMNTQKQEL